MQEVAPETDHESAVSPPVHHETFEGDAERETDGPCTTTGLETVNETESWLVAPALSVATAVTVCPPRLEADQEAVYGTDESEPIEDESTKNSTLAMAPSLSLAEAPIDTELPFVIWAPLEGEVTETEGALFFPIVTVAELVLLPPGPVQVKLYV